MEFKEQISLKPYNTFGIDAKARYFIEVSTIEEIQDLLKHELYKNKDVLWLGGGSNMLLTKDFNGLVVKLSLKGKRQQSLNEQHELVCAKAGENWHSFVQYTLEHNWGGLENLSLIPGNVGTAPIQNIGAYGVEIKDSFHHLKALELASGKIVEFDSKACAFGYRESFFKKEGKGKFIVLEVCFALSKGKHKLHTEYGAIKNALAEMQLEANIQNISKAVIAIRQSKLPDPKEIGNSGSFFKNPIVSKEAADALKNQFPEAVVYPINDKESKLAAGWLIEQCGLKGFRKGDAGVHKKQALVLVNYGNASGKEIADLAEEVKRQVFTKFAVPLEAEVNMI